jgi:GNAT superfamily N-acetyltransferase
LFDTLTAAFATDPAVRWMYPEPQQYYRHFPAFAQAFGGGAVQRGTAFCTDDCAGAALWLPPGVGPDEESLVALLQSSVRAADRDAVFAVFDEMARYHPSEPHWYLPLIGVAPSRQGRGYGSALMEHALRRCDQEGLPAYLESSNPRNVPLYQRHGFEIMGTIQLDSSPPIIPMLRTQQ